MNKRGLTLYLHVHQPYRVRQYSIFDTATHDDYFSANDLTNKDNRAVFLKVAEKSYRPMNQLLGELLAQNPDFRFSISITGTFIEQARAWAPDVLDSFRALVSSGRVEIVGETYHHSLAFFYSIDEFERQVEQHRQVIRDEFGVETTAFRNTELAYNDGLAQWADAAGYRTILAEGWDSVLEWRSANFVYRPAGTYNLRLLMKNYRLSDDIAFRFGDKSWHDWPMTTDKYIRWVEESLAGGGSSVNLFMDYETFGEHQWEATGIFDFMRALIPQWLSNDANTFYTVTDAATATEPIGAISMPHTVTWADTERDLSAWLGNSMQHEAMRHIYALEHDVHRTGDEQLIADWQKLLTSDHAYYMCTKWFNDGDVHAYFSPYESPYDAFLFFMNALRDVRYRVMMHNIQGSTM